MEISALLALIATSAAALPTSYIVSMFKAAKPDASTASIIVVASLAGIACSVLIGLALGTLLPLAAQSVAIVLLQGIGAAAAAAGVDRTANSAAKVVAGTKE